MADNAPSIPRFGAPPLATYGQTPTRPAKAGFVGRLLEAMYGKPGELAKLAGRWGPDEAAFGFIVVGYLKGLPKGFADGAVSLFRQVKFILEASSATVRGLPAILGAHPGELDSDNPMVRFIAAHFSEQMRQSLRETLTELNDISNVIELLGKMASLLGGAVLEFEEGVLSKVANWRSNLLTMKPDEFGEELGWIVGRLIFEVVLLLLVQVIAAKYAGFADARARRSVQAIVDELEAETRVNASVQRGLAKLEARRKRLISDLALATPPADALSPGGTPGGQPLLGAGPTRRALPAKAGSNQPVTPGVPAAARAAAPARIFRFGNLEDAVPSGHQRVIGRMWREILEPEFNPVQREWLVRSIRKVTGVPGWVDTLPDEVVLSFVEKLRRYHPDLHPITPTANRTVAQLQELRVSGLAGELQEVLVIVDPEMAPLISKLRADVAADPYLDAGSLVFCLKVATLENDPNFGLVERPLSDGTWLVNTKHPDAPGMALVPQFHESKSESNFSRLFYRAKTKKLNLSVNGQLTMDVERFSEHQLVFYLPVSGGGLERRVYDIGSVGFSRQTTRVILIAPTIPEQKALRAAVKAAGLNADFTTLLGPAFPRGEIERLSRRLLSQPITRFQPPPRGR